MVGKAIKDTIKQGEKSICFGCCAYSGDNGLKCVIGHMIPDEKYHSVLELSHADDVLQKIGMKITERQAAELDKLQSCHDSADAGYFNEDFMNLLRERAPSLIPKDIGR